MIHFIGTTHRFPPDWVPGLQDCLRRDLPELSGHSYTSIYKYMLALAKERCIWMYRKGPHEFAVAVIGLPMDDIHCMGKAFPIPAFFATDADCARKLYRDLLVFAARNEHCQYLISSRRVGLREYRMKYIKIGEHRG